MFHLPRWSKNLFNGQAFQTNLGLFCSGLGDTILASKRDVDHPNAL